MAYDAQAVTPECGLGLLRSSAMRGVLVIRRSAGEAAVRRVALLCLGVSTLAIALVGCGSNSGASHAGPSPTGSAAIKSAQQGIEAICAAANDTALKTGGRRHSARSGHENLDR